MGIFNSILCPIDLSDHSRHALEYAVGIARHYGASLTALYVIPPPVSTMPGLESPAYAGYVYRPEDFEAIDREVETFVDAARTGLAVQSRVVQGFAVGQILDVAASIGADLMIVGTHGRGGFQRLVLGSVAERVLARANCPVMAIPPHMAETAPVGAPFANILCGIDYTPSSQRALDYATLFARESAGQLTLVHVVEVPSGEPALASGIRGVVEESVFVTAARGKLHAVLPDALPKGDAGGQVVVKTGKPYRGILDAAQRQHCDLIVLGSHGGLANVLGLGSTTNHVLREATCPVLTVRA